MHRRTRQALFAIPIILAIGASVAWAGSQHGESLGGWPVFAVCGGLAFGFNWAVFVHANAFQTEKYFDLAGSATYLLLVGVALAFGRPDARALLLAALVGIWAIRLGGFLFRRISQDGADGRFDTIKPDFSRFLMAWTLQGLWVYLTLSCALAAITASEAPPLGMLDALGALLWLVGFALEGVADAQKRRFRRLPGNRDRFITQGLWAWSRHPNYFGEILLWTGIALIAVSALSGWQYATLVSPVFVYVLLTRISGIPLLEARAQKKWGDEPAFQDYTRRTAELFPRPPAAS